jgi:hypothetical protein
MDLSLRYFFRGHASREMNASAFLATLLEHDDVFQYGPPRSCTARHDRQLVPDPIHDRPIE